MRCDQISRIAKSLAIAASLAFVPIQSKEGLLSAQSPTFTPAARVCTVHDFYTSPADAAAPTQIGAIALGDDGLLYSTSPMGGQGKVTANKGTIFRFSPDPKNLPAPGINKIEILYSFDMGAHGAAPVGGLIKASDGFYGTARDGGLFKTNDVGGTKFGNGVLFRFKPGDKEPEVIHTFRYGDLTGIKPEVCPPKQPCRYSPQQRMNAAGGIPLSAPVLASDGNLYGVTSGAIGFNYLGVLYKVAPYKTESAITALCIGGPMPAPETILTDQQLRDLCMFSEKSGYLPLGLTAGPGELYGTTIGVNATSNGSVFKVDLPSGKVTVLYNFADPKNGRMPFGVILGSDGNLYGVTKYGGPLYGLGNAGAGVVYKLSPAGVNFQIIHAFNGTTEGSMPVAGLVEEKSFYGDYLYGSTTAAGAGARGVLFRLRLDVTPGNPAYEVLHTFPNQWGVTGSFPESTMIATNDKDYGLTFYGTTFGGGTINYGALFRLSGVHLPPMRNLPGPVIYSLRSDYKYIGSVFTIPGQPQPTTVDVYTGAVAQGTDPTKALDNGIMIKAGNCRSPHIVQFIYREKIAADGTHLGGTYTVSNRSYQFTTDPANPFWATDSSATPNAYYDEQQGSPNTINALNLTILDQPNFAGTTYLPGAHETWKATFKDYVICNCQVVREVQWSRQVLWIPDLPTGNNTTLDINKGHQGPEQYGVVTITEPDDPLLNWVNVQVKKDGFQPVP